MHPGFSLHLKANLLLSSLLALLFLNFNTGYSAFSLLMTGAGAVSTVILFYLAFWLLLAPLSFLKRIALYAGSILFVLFDIGLVIDFFIFRLYATHINGMVINIFLSPAASKNVDTGIHAQVMFGLLALFLAGFQGLLIFFLGRSTDRLRSLNQRFNRVIVPVLFTLVLTDKLAFGFVNLFGRVELTQNMRVIPFYQPLTFNRTAEEWFGFEVAEQIVTPGSVQVKNLDYPKSPLRYADGAAMPNILVIVIDSARWDMVTPEVTPNLYRLEQESMVFDRHYSGGNATRFGIFSFFYGLNSPYWFSFLNAQREAVLFGALRHRNYRIGIFASSDLNWPEFRKTAFVGVPGAIVDDFEGEIWERDAKMNEAVIRWVNGITEDRPFFGFLFYDCPHQYSYPPTQARFLPDAGGKKDYLTLEASEREVLFNQYRNSIHYDDDLIGRVLQALKEKGLMDKTRIIVTADHGEEFFESGGFGHNSSFSEQQIRPVLFMRIPGVAPATVTRMTSHLDIAPTLMNWLGVENPPSDYSLGEDLFSRDYGRESAFTGNWSWNVIVTPGYKLVFSTRPNPVDGVRVFETETYKKCDSAITRQFSGLILRTLEENGEFYR